jgi:hypothetical protein
MRAEFVKKRSANGSTCSIRGGGGIELETWRRCAQIGSTVGSSASGGYGTMMGPDMMGALVLDRRDESALSRQCSSRLQQKGRGALHGRGWSGWRPLRSPKGAAGRPQRLRRSGRRLRQGG